MNGRLPESVVDDRHFTSAYVHLGNSIGPDHAAQLVAYPIVHTDRHCSVRYVFFGIEIGSVSFPAVWVVQQLTDLPLKVVMVAIPGRKDLSAASIGVCGTRLVVVTLVVVVVVVPLVVVTSSRFGPSSKWPWPAYPHPSRPTRPPGHPSRDTASRPGTQHGPRL